SGASFLQPVYAVAASGTMSPNAIGVSNDLTAGFTVLFIAVLRVGKLPGTSRMTIWTSDTWNRSAACRNADPLKLRPHQHARRPDVGVALLHLAGDTRAHRGCDRVLARRLGV